MEFKILKLRTLTERKADESVSGVESILLSYFSGAIRPIDVYQYFHLNPVHMKEKYQILLKYRAETLLLRCSVFELFVFVGEESLVLSLLDLFGNQSIDFEVSPWHEHYSTLFQLVLVGKNWNLLMLLALKFPNLLNDVDISIMESVVLLLVVPDRAAKVEGGRDVDHEGEDESSIERFCVPIPAQLELVYYDDMESELAVVLRQVMTCNRNILYKRKNGLNILQLICLRCSTQLLQSLPSILTAVLECGIDVNEQLSLEEYEDFQRSGECGVSAPGDSALHIVCSNVQPNTKSTIKLLCEHGASVNLQNTAGRTPIHQLVWEGLDNVGLEFAEDILLIVLSCGANMSCRDNDDNTPFDLMLKSNLWRSAQRKHFPRLLMYQTAVSVGQADVLHWRTILQGCFGAMQQISEQSLQEHRQYLMSSLALNQYHSDKSSRKCLQQAFKAVGSCSSIYLDSSIRQALRRSNRTDNPNDDYWANFFMSTVGMRAATAEALSNKLNRWEVSSYQELALHLFERRIEWNQLELDSVGAKLLRIALTPEFKKIASCFEMEDSANSSCFEDRDVPDSSSTQSCVEESVGHNFRSNYERVALEFPLEESALTPLRFEWSTGSFTILGRSRCRAISGLFDGSEVERISSTSPQWRYSFVFSTGLSKDRMSTWQILLKSMVICDIFVGVVASTALSNKDFEKEFDDSIRVMPFQQFKLSGFHLIERNDPTESVGPLLYQYCYGCSVPNSIPEAMAVSNGDLFSFSFEPDKGRLSMMRCLREKMKQKETADQELGQHDTAVEPCGQSTTSKSIWSIDGLETSCHYRIVIGSSAKFSSVCLLSCSVEDTRSLCQNLAEAPKHEENAVSSPQHETQRVRRNSSEGPWSVSSLSTDPSGRFSSDTPQNDRFSHNILGSPAERREDVFPDEATQRLTATTASLSSPVSSKRRHRIELAQLPQLLRNFYVRMNPSRIEKVPEILEAYKGREVELIRKLERQYRASFIPQ